MFVIKKIKEYIGNYFLNQELKKISRIKKLLNYTEIKNIGILYKFDSENTYNKVSGFVEKMKNDNKKLKALGFIKDKKISEKFLPKLSFDFFSENDLNWYKKPDNKYVRDFINTEFDLLINLDFENIFPLKYITAKSKAFLKTGLLNDQSSKYFDLMIKMDNSKDLDEFFSQVIHYLSIINKKGNN
ncbi:MAG: hypothetical protein JEY97_14980 [Bacteroidales bacterium]|nr:hypothetical protein [Bacteroidales bacterium]